MKTRMSSSDRKQSIVLAAIPLFARHGFKKTTTKEIAQTAGISEALLYKHFKSKEELYGLIQSQCCSSSQKFAEQLALLEPGPQAVILLVSVLALSMLWGLDGEEELSIVKRLMLNSLLDEGDFAKLFLDHHITLWMPKIVEAFEACEKSGAFVRQHQDFVKLTWHLHHSISGHSFFQMMGTKLVDFGEIKEFVKQTIEYNLYAIGLKDQIIKDYFKFNDIWNFFVGEENV